MSKPFTLPQAEPAMVRAVVVALAFLASLGIGWAADVDADTITVWALVLGGALPVLQGLWTRYGVTANAKVLARVTSDRRVVAGDAAVEPTGTEVDQPQAALGTGEAGVYYHVERPARVVAAVVVKPELAPPA